MRRTVGARWLLLVVLAIAAGCADNALVLRGQVDKYQQEQLAMSRQAEQLRVRLGAMDRDNQELGTMMAQSRQQTQILEDQLSATRDQLTAVTSQLARVRDESESSQKQVQAMTASMERRGGVSITPNSSLRQPLPQINAPDVYIRRDGDLVRVELPGGALFESGSARLRPGAIQLITDVANEVARTYPGQLIGVEGHTDTDPIASPQWRNNHQLSVGRAMAVYDVIVGQARISPNQLTISGHGENQPVASNATLAGKQRNRRVELVVYPQRAGP